ncbi:YdiY family protein [Elusimicrobiota bacterium]
MKKILIIFTILVSTVKGLALAEKLWEIKSSLGYNSFSGNTDSQQLAIDVFANRKTNGDEFTVSGNTYYSAISGQLDAERWYNMVRYAFSFGEKRWFNFYKVETDHDRFTNIDYRIVPSIGVGYWHSDKPDWKLMGEVGAGYVYTAYTSTSSVENNGIILVARVFLEKGVFDSSKITQQVKFYHSLDDINNFRIFSETSFINPVNKNISIKFSLVDEYNSQPAVGAEKNDLRFMTLLTYTY